MIDHGCDVNFQDHRGWTALMVAAHRGHTEMVLLLLKEGGADTSLADSYGKKAIDRAHSSHISYMIASASIENRMKDLSTTLNINEYSPERNSKAHSRSRIAQQQQDGPDAVETFSNATAQLSTQKSQKTLKSILLTTAKKRAQHSPLRGTSVIS